MGDFWGYKKINKKLNADNSGVSALKVATRKGMILINEVKSDLYLYEVTLSDIYDNNHSWPVDFPPEREEIFNDFLETDDNTIKILKKYNSRYSKKK